MWDCYSTTYPNYTSFQAWRAGFREGVKMSLNRGLRPEIEEFKDTVASRNIDNLTVWQNVGRDVENGDWAIYGARLGTYMTMLTDWNPQNVQWFDNYPVLWEEHKDKDPDSESTILGEALNNKLGLPMHFFDAGQSKYIKRLYGADKYNKGPLVKEMDEVRRIQGW
jgi:hypothetical protein